MSFWPGRRVVVTGGAGFLGSFVVEKLRAHGCGTVVVPRRAEYDLTINRLSEKINATPRP